MYLVKRILLLFHTTNHGHSSLLCKNDYPLFDSNHHSYMQSWTAYYFIFNFIFLWLLSSFSSPCWVHLFRHFHRDYKLTIIMLTVNHLTQQPHLAPCPWHISFTVMIFCLPPVWKAHGLSSNTLHTKRTAAHTLLYMPFKINTFLVKSCSYVLLKINKSIKELCILLFLYLITPCSNPKMWQL